MLLVYDHERQMFKLHRLLNQRVRADDNGISPLATHFRSCAREMLVILSRPLLEGNLKHPEPVISPMLIGKIEVFNKTTQSAAWPKFRSGPCRQPGACQSFDRRAECVPRSIGGSGGNGCLARADVALEQARHRVAAAHIFKNCVDRFFCARVAAKGEGATNSSTFVAHQ
jgi:hypothetical protein